MPWSGLGAIVGFGLLAACTLGSVPDRSGARLTPRLPEVTLTVDSQPRQRFEGFGTSLLNADRTYHQLTPNQRRSLHLALWQDLQFRHLRLWFDLPSYAPNPTKRDVTQFRRTYVDNGLIREAQQAGVKTLLLAPDSIPDWLREKSPEGSVQTGMRLKPGMEVTYAEVLANFIADLKQATGIQIQVTGLQNEPNDNDRILPGQIVQVVKALRKALDQRGLRSVEIIAPENANVDQILLDTIGLLKRDRSAWQSLAGISAHTYNMGATPELADQLEGKAYWMTESGENGAEEPGDKLRSIAMSSRVLNDLNHGTTHWFHFIGWEVSDPNDNATRIFRYDVRPFRLVTFQKFFQYQQLSQTFPVGTQFRRIRSSLDGPMSWTYGKKPRIFAAIGKAPDGSWRIGMSNFTHTRFRHSRDVHDQTGHPAQPYRVTLRIGELTPAKSLKFQLVRSIPNKPGQIEAITLHQGELNLTIAPTELITLRSQ
jgi:O-glycosyl hydrolase